MDSLAISISDDEDTTAESSLTSTSDSDLWNSEPDPFIDLMTPHPTCVPPVYQSSSPVKTSGRKYKYYVVFVGDQPGCYRDWADASGRVTNYPGNMYKRYDSYEEALAGWRQHCHGFHNHPPGFIDGSLFVSPRAPQIPKTPPPTIPPPANINVVSVPESSPMQTSSQINPSVFPSLAVPMTPSSSHRSPRVDAEAPTPQCRSRVWAIHSPRFNSVVPSSAQADKILARAIRQGEEVEVREVDGVAQAEEWFGTLSLDE
ncbi:hypothetical protein C8R42DRAFT_639015 [Lentinula raphanica]|nr:hypothetical protein C8R42DRAFT_639015 [Lentinula raphanica]